MQLVAVAEVNTTCISQKSKQHAHRNFTAASKSGFTRLKFTRFYVHRHCLAHLQTTRHLYLFRACYLHLLLTLLLLREYIYNPSSLLLTVSATVLNLTSPWMTILAVELWLT